MRSRAYVALVVLLLPAALSAQRLGPPRVGGRIPIGSRPLEPQPPAIARELAYKRSHISVESYPFISYDASPGIAGSPVAQRRTSFGAGTRADYRITRFLSATLDMTSAFLGGPSNTETAELGIRLRPERTERRVYPFVDARAGYVQSFDSFVRPFDVISGSPLPVVEYGSRYSQGVGGVAGAGMEYALTRRFSLTTAASVLRSNMTAYRSYGAAPTRGYVMTTYRFMLGVRFNPGHLIPPT